MKIRLQKVLAAAGVASRRQAEQLIISGQVTVNRKPAELGMQVDPNVCDIWVAGRPIPPITQQLKTEVHFYYKPMGIICTKSDPEGRPTVFSQLPRRLQRAFFMVGRLDINTSGLLLFTNNGELANRLMHPKWEVPRAYVVRVFGEVDKFSIKKLCEGVKLEDGPAKFDKVEKIGGGDHKNHWYRVELREGRNREVRRLWEAVGVQVSRLIRVQYGPIEMPSGLHRGKVVQASPAELSALMKSVEL
jgi:23S rRNA pseudouridine2605 synthase